MDFNNFRLQLVLRTILLVVSIVATVLLAVLSSFLFTSIIAGVLSLLQIILFILYAETATRKTNRFFDSISFSDFTANFSNNPSGTSFNKLNRKFNDVINHFKASSKEREEQFDYLKTIVDHISIGVVVFQNDGRVDLVNNSFRKILHISSVHDIKDIKKVDLALAEAMISIKSGHSCLKKLFVGNEFLQLSIYATKFRMRGEEFMMISIQNIHNELEENEIESWQKLTRVLTHEIMNSITPISSLASSVKDLVVRNDGSPKKTEEIDDECLESVQLALTTIEKRSAGLLNFVEVYRNLTRIPKPNFSHFPVRELFNRVTNLMQTDLDQKGIRIECNVFPQQIMITADPDLIEQVLINLLLNSVYALRQTKSPQIRLVASADDGSSYIQVTDNGSGITEDLMDKIFIPFFTSRKDGSGIGLSLSRQIMHLHRGSIYAKSTPFVETVFTLTL